MLRYYVTTRETWSGYHPFGDRQILPRYNLFSPETGSHWVEIGDGLILLSTDFHRTDNEAAWHAITDVARLPHPQFEHDVPVHHLHSKPEWKHKQFAKHHHQALQQKFELADHHTVWDLQDHVIPIAPMVRLGSRY